MFHSKKKQFKVCLALGAVLMTALAGCNRPEAELPAAPPSLTATIRLTPYNTPTASATLPAPTPLAAIPLTPAPTPTPFTHTIVKGETLLGIALRYGVDPEDIQAANLDIDPNFLSIGATLIIPIEGDIPEIIPTATPVPVHMEPAQCYRTADDGAWCFLLAKNEQQEALENLTAWIGLFSDRGENLVGAVALAPLNLLKPQAALPLVAFFPPPLPDNFTARGELLTTLPVGAGDARYLEAEVVDLGIEIGPDGDQAAVSGKLAFQEDMPPARSAWVAVVAYGPGKEVVGLRKWQAEVECSGFEDVGDESSLAPLPPECLAFEMTVFSLGPTIRRVEVLVEARP